MKNGISFVVIMTLMIGVISGCVSTGSAEAGDSDPEVSSDTLGEVYPPDVREMIYEFGVQLRDEAGYTDLDPNDPEAVIAARKDYYSNEEPVVIPDDSADGEELPGEITETSRSVTLTPVEPQTVSPETVPTFPHGHDFLRLCEGDIDINFTAPRAFAHGDGGNHSLGAFPENFQNLLRRKCRAKVSASNLQTFKEVIDTGVKFNICGGSVKLDFKGPTSHDYGNNNTSGSAAISTGSMSNDFSVVECGISLHFLQGGHRSSHGEGRFGRSILQLKVLKRCDKRVGGYNVPIRCGGAGE